MKKKEEPEFSRALVPKHNTLYKIIIAILIVVIVILLGVYFGIIMPNVNSNKSSGDNNQVVLNSTGVELSKLNYEGKTSDREIGKTQMKIEYADNCNFTISYPQIGIEEIDEIIIEHTRELKDSFLNKYRITDSTENTPIYTEHIDYRSKLIDGNKMQLVLIDSVIKDESEMISKNEYTYEFDLNTGYEVSNDGGKNVPVDPMSVVSEIKPIEYANVEGFELLYSGDVIKFATATINIRAEKNTSSEIIGTIKEGDPIEVRGLDGDWEMVVYDGRDGFIKDGYLSRKKELQRDVELVIVDRNIDPSKPMVAITFDDGPNPNSTPRILDTLEQYGVVATFFDLGQLVNSYPDIVRREEKIGCEVGNHSYSHKNFNLLNDEEIQQEIKLSEEAFIKALGHKTRLYRLPYGNVNLRVKENLNYPIIKWNVDSLDWKSRNKNKILTQIRNTKDYDGSIILLHSIYTTTADAVEVLVPELIKKGYQLVTVSELAYYKGNKVIRTAQEYRHF